MKSRKTIWLFSLAAIAIAGYGGWLAYLASRDLVTLDVRNMDVRDVVKKIERQTWETILVEKGVEGRITLKVRRAPLQEVLRLVAGQTFSRPSVLYPLYSNGKALSVLQQALRGEIDPSTHGWTNLQSRGPMGMGPGPMFGMGGFPGQNSPVPSQRVSLKLVGKDVAFATLAFARLAQVRVVPQDGTAATINLELKDATVRSAVAQLANKAHRNWTTLYALQGGFGGPGPGGPSGGPQFAARGPDDGPRGDGPRFGFGGPDMSDEKREEMRKQRETLEAELAQALPIEERRKLEAAQQERERLMQEMASMTDEQRRDRMMQMGSRNMSQMNRERLMNSTPEQRAQMSQRMSQMQMRGPGEPGGQRPPGGPPR